MPPWLSPARLLSVSDGFCFVLIFDVLAFHGRSDDVFSCLPVSVWSWSLSLSLSFAVVVVVVAVAAAAAAADTVFVEISHFPTAKPLSHAGASRCLVY